MADSYMKPIITGWLAKINLAIQHRRPFMEIAEQCMAFYAGAVDFMWTDTYRKKFLKGNISPKFRLSLCKAFEFVALYGPVLYYRNPTRTVKPYEPIEFGPELFGDPNDPNVQVYYQQMMQQEGEEKSRADVRCQLMEKYLNYTPREQPNGGLKQAAEDAITECLIKGRGVLWPEVYTFPNSQRRLTGCFYDSQDNLVHDPDALSFDFGETKWIARKHVMPTWEIEERFNLPKDSLRGKGTLESAEMQASRKSAVMTAGKRNQGLTFDLMTWWEVWSVGGVGSRLLGVKTDLAEALDEVLGDYAYICVAPNIPYPLNAHDDFLQTATPEDLQGAFSWPVPYWMDRRWPCAELRFYSRPGSQYPVPPIAPGLGELTLLNIIISHLCSRVVSSSRDFIAVLQSAAADVENILKNGEDLALIRLKDMQQDINKVVSFLQQPSVNFDVWKIIEQLFDLFDKRVGLSELLYGLNPGGAASRSATDAQSKQSNLSVRPDHMSGKVEAWMADVAEMEKLCAYWQGISSQDVGALMGPTGAQLWDQLIMQEDPEVVARQMSATVEAQSARKPNRERDAQNIQTILPVIMPELSKTADITGDTMPINAFLKLWGKTMDQSMDEMMLPPRMPPPPPMPEEQPQPPQ